MLNNYNIAVIGINHKTADVDVREKAVLDNKAQKELMAAFYARYANCGFMILSTCNRTEVYLTGKKAIREIQTIRKLVDDKIQNKIFTNNEITYEYHESDAVDHLFKVTSSMDSQMIGEPQITGQVKDAYEYAHELGYTDIRLNKLFNFAIQAEKKIRNETYLNDGAVSISFAGVELAKKIYNNLEDKVVLLIGVGETAELAALHFRQKYIRDIFIVNRTLKKAEALAKDFEGTALPFDELESVLEKVDIVISATSSSEYIIHKSMLEKVVTKRNFKPIFLIDLAIPRDIEPASDEVEGVFLYNLDALQEIVNKNLEKRKLEIPKANKIIQLYLNEFDNWFKTRPITHTITQLNNHFNAVRKNEFNRLKKRFPKENWSEVEYLTKSLMKKFLHQHIIMLRRNIDKPKQQERYLELMNEIYGLEDAEDKNGSEN